MESTTVDGVAMSVAGLYPLCLQGYTMVQGLFDAPQAVKPALAMLFIQSGVFLAWGEWWGLGDAPQTKPVRAGKTKLEAYFANTSGIGQRFLAVLVAMSNTFANVKDLELLYNLKIRDESGVDLQHLELDAGRIIQGENPINRPVEMKKRQRHMSFLSRAKFEVEDSKGLERLASQLEHYIDVLLKLCPERTVEKIERAMLSRFLWNRNDPQELLDIQWAAKEESVRRSNLYQRYKIYDLLASTAGFKAELQSAIADVPAYSSEDYHYGGGRQSWDFNGGEGTMAVSNRYGTVRFVEWKYYRKTNGVENADDIRDIRQLASILGSDEYPPEIRTLKCLGVFKDAARSRYGLLYQPPAYIEEMDGEKRSPNSVPKSRKPVSLFHLLRTSSEPLSGTIMLDLSVRFRLAKQLVQSVYVMHAAGLLHKNLRARSVLFLPAESQHGGPSKSGRKRYDQPWIGCYGRSTSDEPEIAELETALSSKGLRANINKKREAWYGDPAPPKEIRRKPCRRMTDFADLSIYQHPERRLDPTRRYTAAYDVYSLGCVLLEIGLWQTLESFNKDYPALQFQGVLLDLTSELVGQMGSKYAAAVRECLSITSTDGKAGSDREACRVLCWKVAAALDSCSA